MFNRKIVRSCVPAGLALVALLFAHPSQAQTPFIGEIKLVPYNFAPQGWALCDGSLQSIDQNAALFALIGTTYGGDGQSTFALPDLRGRVPVGMGQGPGLQNYVIGEMAGLESVTLTVSQMPAHAHSAAATVDEGWTDSPAGGLPARDAAGIPHYGSGAPMPLSSAAIGLTGGNQPHDNMPPYLVQNYVIALFGIFPSQSKPEPGVQAIHVNDGAAK